MGQRPHDSKAIPLCQKCHVDELHAAKGWARGLEKPHIRAWEEAMVELTRRRAREAGWFVEDESIVRIDHERMVEVF